MNAWETPYVLTNCLSGLPASDLWFRPNSKVIALIFTENFNRLMGLLIRCPPPVVHKHKHSLTGNTMFLFHLHSQKRKPLTKTEACNIKLFTSMHSVTCLNRFNALWAKGNSRQLLINILQLQYLLTLNLARTDRGYRQCIHGEKIC